MTTYGKKWKNLVLVLSLLFVFFIGYKSIRAITNEDNQILNSLKDGSETADFNYQLNLEETISVLYKDSSINNLVTKYIINRTDDKYLVEVKDVSNSGGVYNVLYNGGSYTGDFTYSFTNKLNIDLVDNDRIKSIKDYIRDKYSINDDIDVTYKGRDIYNIRINLKDYDFNIEFNTENTISTFNSTENNNVNNSIAINYQAHVESIGWQSYVNNGETAGTTGQSKQMEALKIKIVNNTGITGGIEYQTHVESIGWQNYVSDGEIAGTTGQGKQIVAIRIRLTGDLANSYDIYYRVHVSDIGWMAWTCNDEAAGTSGFGKQVEAIEIKLVKKGDEAPDTTGNAYLKPEQNLEYQAHVESIGWQNYVNNGETAGTTGQGKQVEALKVKISNQDLDGKIEYQAYVESIGWQSYVSDGEIAGTTGQGKQIVAIRIRLTGDLANSYDIYYRVHVSDIGWMAWTCNDEAAGTSGFGKQVEAIEIKLVKKGDEAPDTTGNAYLKPEQNLEYQAHVESIGWQNYVNNGETAGTTGQGKQVEALKVKISNQDLDGKIEYQAYVESIGWQSYVSDGEIAGTTGQGKQVEAIRIRLTGDLANSYDIYYRVHISEIGWMAWTCNDKAAGTVGFSKQVEAIEIRLIKKGDETPEINGDSYVEKGTDINYSSHVSEIGWQNNVKNGLTSGTTGQGKQIEAIKIAVSSSLAGNITYQTYIEKTGWQNNVNNGEISGTTGLGRKIETIKISLNGTISSYYDVYYRTHVSNVGWLDWTCNGQPSGSSGIDMAIEAIEIVLVPKGADAPGATTNAYVTGKWVTDSNNNTYYYDAFGNMARDFKMIDGVKYFFNSLGVLIGSNVKKVIDVSKHQGIIDWETIKRNGDVDAVILRVAAGYAKVDDMFARNVSELNRLGIPYGIYLYSYAENQIGYAEGLGRMHEGALEAMRIIKTIKDYNVNLSLPIYYDLEKWKGSTINQNWTIDNYRPIVEAFDKVMTEYGYNSSWAIYANKYWAEDRLYEWDNRIRWIAQYNHYCYYKGSYDMWQYSSTESVAGINGDVDVSVLFS